MWMFLLLLEVVAVLVVTMDRVVVRAEALGV